MQTILLSMSNTFDVSLDSMGTFFCRCSSKLDIKLINKWNAMHNCKFIKTFSGEFHFFGEVSLTHSSIGDRSSNWIPGECKYCVWDQISCLRFYLHSSLVYRTRIYGVFEKQRIKNLTLINSKKSQIILSFFLRIQDDLKSVVSPVWPLLLWVSFAQNFSNIKEAKPSINILRMPTKTETTLNFLH